MQAAWFESFGPARQVLRVGEQPQPEPGPGQVLVRLRTSGVNPSDVKKRAGSSPALLDQGLVIPNSDGAGVIEAAGSGVPASRVGERVWVYQAQHGRRFGTAAQYVAIDAARAAPLPAKAGFEVGACLGIPAMTAHRCVFADGPVAGQCLLVTGGAGRVGWYATQWAKSAGARVIATASKPADEQDCREAGADAVVNHREPGWGDRVREANGGAAVDRVVEVEFGGNLHEVLACIRTGGVIATYASAQVTEPKLPFYRMMYADLTVHTVLVYVMPEAAKQAAIADITRALAGGTLRHRIARRLPLGSIAEANELVERGAQGGCVVVDIE
ncbi:MAG TPA: NADPH:quinone reductase [Steroidobacteraceae bacterium]|nr:NADPH:quinone reductase [Steroidobacteraceae bacterium]